MRVLVMFVCALTLGLASVAVANVPDLSNCTAETAYHAGGGTEAVTLFVLPDGNGNSFANAAIADGTTVDGTVTLFLRNSMGGGIGSFPAEDMYLASLDGGLAVCTNGAIADGPTDTNGMAQWADPLFAGGSSEALCQVFIAGDPITGSVAMALNFNSADIDADGAVGLSDVGLFATDFFGAYNFRSDFVFDGELGLADVGLMAVGNGAVCP